MKTKVVPQNGHILCNHTIFDVLPFFKYINKH